MKFYLYKRVSISFEFLTSENYLNGSNYCIKVKNIHLVRFIYFKSDTGH